MIWFADPPLSVRYPIYTRANTVESLPNPMTPLSATLGMMGSWERGMRNFWVSTGGFSEDDFEADRPARGSIGGYHYINISFYRVVGVRTPGLSPEKVDFQYFGSQPGLPGYQPEAWHVDAAKSQRLAEFFDAALAGHNHPDFGALTRSVDEVVATRPALASLDDGALVARMRGLYPTLVVACEQLIFAMLTAGRAVAALTAVCERVERGDLPMVLTSAIGDVESARPGFELWDLSRAVRRSVVLTALFDDASGDLEKRLVADEHDDVRALHATLERFLLRFGYRGVAEFEMQAATWETEPGLVLDAVDRLRKVPDEQSPYERNRRLAEQRTEARQVLLDLLPIEAERDDAARALRAAERLLAAREESKANTIRVFHEMKLLAWELGRRHAARRQLERAEHVFMLLDEQLDDFVLHPEAWTETLAERAHEHARIAGLEAPFVVVGQPPPLATWALRSARREVKIDSRTLTGIAAVPGTYTGRARTVLDPGADTFFEPGDVLVAHATDPSWVPFFLSAGAVVNNTGSQLTHSVIMARELGVPCVVSVEGATDVLDGRMVCVDGTAGTVTLLDDVAVAVP
jgi:pyruvate,water dikinase